MPVWRAFVGCLDVTGGRKRNGVVPSSPAAPSRRACAVGPPGAARVQWCPACHPAQPAQNSAWLTARARVLTDTERPRPAAGPAVGAAGGQPARSCSGSRVRLIHRTAACRLGAVYVHRAATFCLVGFVRVLSPPRSLRLVNFVLLDINSKLTRAFRIKWL